MPNETVNIVHELTFVTNDASVQKVDQTISTLTRSLQALTQNTKQVGSNLNSIVTNLGNASKAANDYANSMNRAAAATAKFGQASSQNANVSNAASAKIAAGLDRTLAKFQQMQQTLAIMSVAQNKRVQYLADEANALRNAAAEAERLKSAYSGIKGVQPRATSTSSGGGGSSSGPVNPDDDAQRIFGVKLSAIQRRFVTGYIVGAGFSAFNATIDTIKDFVSNSSRFASEMEGVTKAFERLGDPDLLKRLREATGGTVSDLDLMQRTVNAVNLGLPVEQFANALNFAKIRARETGQDVNYLVESIALGIGRKSPLILDNLGISALRVRERFKEVGSFSKAAFEIIQEELAKSGEYVDQFTDRMDRLTASIKNQQTEFGKNVNAIEDYGIAALLDLKDLITLRANERKSRAAEQARRREEISDENKSYTDRLQEAREAAEEGAKRTTEANALAARRYGEFYQEFENKLVNADAAARKEILKQADDMYSSLVKKATDFAKASGLDVSVLLKSFDDMKQRFDRASKESVPDITKLTVERLRQAPLSRDVLVETQGQVKLARSPLDINQTDEIARLDAVDDEITRQLKIIDGHVKAANKARTLASEELNLTRQIAKAREDIVKEQLEREANSNLKIEELHKAELRRSTETLDGLEADLVRRGIINDKATGKAKEISDKNKALLKELRDLNIQLVGVQFSNAQAALFDQQRDALNRAFRNRVGAASDLRADYVAEGGVSSIAKIRKQVELERRAADAEEIARHEDALRELQTKEKENQKAIEEEDDAHYLRREDIRLKYQHREIEAIKTHFDQIRAELQRQVSLEAAALQAIQAGEQQDLNDTYPGGLFFDREHRQRIIEAGARRRQARLGVSQAQQELRNAEIEDALARSQAIVNRQTAGTPSAIRAAEDAQAKLNTAKLKSAEATKEQIDSEKNYQKVVLENIPKILDLYSSMASTAVDAYSSITQAQQQQLSQEIQIREQRLQLAERFAERGNTTYLRQEQDRLDRAYKQQAQAARQQIAINTALAASNAAVGVVKAAASGTEGGPYLIAANVIAFIAAITAGIVAANNAANNATPSVQFYKGGYTGDGGKYQEAGTVHKGEFVTNQETTRRHRKVLEAMHDGTFDDKYARVDEKALRMDDGRPAKDKDTLNKLDEVIEAVEGSTVTVRQSLDKHGLLQMVERTIKTDRQRFS